MRQLDLSLGVDFPQGKYTVRNLLLEFVLGADWSQDEASIAAFDRITAAIKGDGKLEEKDFQAVCTRVKSVQFPAHVALELGWLRNQLVIKTPKDDA